MTTTKQKQHETIENRRCSSIERNKSKHDWCRERIPTAITKNPAAAPSGNIYRIKDAYGHIILEIQIHPGNRAGQFKDSQILRFYGPDGFVMAAALKSAGLMPDDGYLNRPTAPGREDARLRKILSEHFLK